MSSVRCAIYTRKSSDEGLEQSFNSLDAQREACAAYILSQTSEGWVEVPERYDDGGISGGTLDRPALQKLIGEVQAGRVDTVVVYKVDRLTRSLMDFSKLVEVLDNAGVNFVSVTRSFNTTTSMGRLTLNMLLSFAQFEREVTAERIRDKIAASKAKGMWMGGVPPLGYKPDGRSLAIVEPHAALVRTIFQRYLAVGNIRMLTEQFVDEGLLAPTRSLRSGKTIGGGAFSRGQLYLMLKCRTYLGEIAHKGQVFPGLHPPIVDRGIWDAVQARLAEHTQGSRTRVHTEQPSPLAGRVFDESGEPLVPVHACKGNVRYRYYVSRSLQHGESEHGIRVPAREIEAAVAERLARMFDDPLELVAQAALDVDVLELGPVQQKAAMTSASLRLGIGQRLSAFIDRVVVHRDAIDVDCSGHYVASALGLRLPKGAPTVLNLAADVRLARSGRAVKLVYASGGAANATPDASIVRLLAQAHRYWRNLRAERITVGELAKREGVTASWLTRVLRLAFLSPKIANALLAGQQRANVDAGRLLQLAANESCWCEQEAALLPA